MRYPSTGFIAACLALVAVLLSPGDVRAQGAIVNGATHVGTIPIGDVDTWTFNAAINDSITIRLGEVAAIPDPQFSPRIRLIGVNSAVLGDNAGATTAEIDVRAPLSGTYTVLVSHSPVFPAQTGTGSYTFTVAKTPGPYSITPGDEGGPLVNGATTTGTIGIGDLDVFTIEAGINDSITIRLGEVTTGEVDPLFAPRIRLRGPDGAPLGDNGLVNTAELDVRAPLTGIYTVIVTHSIFFPAQVGVGTYAMTVVKTPGPYTISINDEGGPAVNGFTHTGFMPLGDIDTYTIQAAKNDNITIRVGEMSVGEVDPVFAPRIRLRGPDGAPLGDNGLADTAEIEARAPLSGVYTVLVTHSIFFPAQIGTGKYRLTVAKTPGPVITSPGDEGGDLVNGATHTGVIQIGDLDAYTIFAAKGDSLTMRIGEIVTSEVDPLFSPRLRLRGPDGAPLGDNSGADTAEIDFRATLSGVYTVIVTQSIFFSAQTHDGTYRLTVAKTPGPYIITPGDDGGSIANGSSRSGVMEIGDLDAYSFCAAAGANIVVSVGEVLSLGRGGVDPLFSPRIRLRGPDGAPLGDISGATSAQITRNPAPLSGIYTVLVTHSIFFSAQIATGRYTLTVTGASCAPGIPPIITKQPLGQTISTGTSATMTVEATPADVTYQWYVGTTGNTASPIPNATSSSYTTPALSTTTSYWVRVSNAAGSVDSVTAVVTVTCSVMTLDNSTLNFAATRSAVGFVEQTQPQKVRLLQLGSCPVTWTVTSLAPWLTVTPSSGTGSATLTIGVTFTPSLPLLGTSTGAVTFTFTGSGNSAGPVTVSLATMPPGTSKPPYGAVDTPSDGSTGVTGSVPVTGWALDDLEVRSVRIMREAEGSGLVFIGNATFIDNARSDVGAGNPGVPRRSRGGWGYMMLTNFLPGGGNGTYRLHAIADDGEGHSTDLGTKTITCSNSSATRPFGAIDTPAQGETVSGVVANFGWVLVRGPACASPPNGSIQVLIDNAPVGSPILWTSRPDLSALFAATSYPCVTTALAVFALDTTLLENGLHTIAWVVTADNGQTDGVGSRFFTVANGQSGPSLSAAPAVRQFIAAAFATPATLDALPLDRGTIAARRGFDLEAPAATVRASADGRATILAEETDPVELQLGGSAGDEYVGFLRTPDGFAPLPAGSRLDPATGVFTWQPIAGFVHAYDLVFVRAANGRPAARREVRVVLNPRGGNRVGPQVQIDIPAANATVDQPFFVAGWALDRDDEAGTGISGLHAWAYPVAGGSPIFLGAANYGGARPDVGAVFGPRFRDSGYGFTVDGLMPGTYDIAVFAWSAVENRFLPAKVVRVTVR